MKHSTVKEFLFYAEIKLKFKADYNKDRRHSALAYQSPVKRVQQDIV
jgi:transposase InsO family protein